MGQPRQYLNQVHQWLAALASVAVLTFALAPTASAQTADADRPAPSARDLLDTPGARAGNLLVTPTRVIFSGRTRSAELILKNIGAKRTTYRLDVIDFEIDESGNMTASEDFADSAKSMLRFSPRQVTLEPGTMQKVKLLLRKSSSLANGEYRSHLKFQALPDQSIGADVEASTTSEGLSVKLIPLIGLSIPVVAQHGELSTKLGLTAKKSGNKIHATLTRSGERSVFGDIMLRQDGKAIAHANTSVLRPMTKREVSFEIPEATNLKDLTIEFVETNAKDGVPTASFNF